MSYDTLASSEVIAQTIAALKERNISAQLVNNKSEALEAVKKLLPDQAEIMTGGSCDDSGADRLRRYSENRSASLAEFQG